MIPIYDDNPTRRVPWMTLTLLAANVAVFGFEVTRSPSEFAALIDRFAFIAARFFADPGAPAQLLSVVTAMFLHAGWLHLGGNMLYLWIFGNNVEDRFGPVRFIAFYLVCGAVATLTQASLAPGSTTPLVGASGAIAGVLGAYLLLYPRARIVTVIPIFFYLELAALPALFVIGFWFVLQLAQGVTALGGLAGAGVAWWAHVGGFAAGVVLALPALVVDKARARR